MKTAEEWQRDYEYADPQMVRDIQRDAWEAATKEQLEINNQAVMEDGITLHELAPFPGETK